jgi:hypothetical protein
LITIILILIKIIGTSPIKQDSNKQSSYVGDNELDGELKGLSHGNNSPEGDVEPTSTTTPVSIWFNGFLNFLYAYWDACIEKM